MAEASGAVVDLAGRGIAVVIPCFRVRDHVLGVLVDGTPVEFAVSNRDGIRRLTFDASLEHSRHIVIDLE